LAPPPPAPPAPAPHGTPPERRGLIATLAAIETALLALPLFGQSLFAPPVEPVAASGPLGCFQGGGGGTTVIDGTAPCTGGAPNQILILFTLLAVMLGLLVMPVLIGYFSRRWQTALGAPSIPLWALTVVAAVLTVLARVNGLGGGFPVSTPVDSYGVIFSLVFYTPLILMVLVAGGLGGLAWLVRRGFAR
jgi:hypothetical protein